MTLDELPKVELHLHLEGAVSPLFVRDLALKKNIDLSKIFSQDGNYNFRNFNHFLSVYEAASSVLQSPEDFYNLTMNVLKECAANNVVYVETFLSPQFCGGNKLTSWKDYLAAIQSASMESQRKYNIISRGIVTVIRHLGPDVAMETAKCAVATASEWLVGFGMAGDETVGQQNDYRYSFDMARDAGLKLTSHAGEWCGSGSVADAVNHLKVQRVGHGVQAIEDPAVVKLLVDQEIVLETCPGSNVFLGVYPDLASHPIQKLRELGVKVTISTDDPPFFRTSMNKEYKDLVEVFDWTQSDFIELNKVALEAAFCDDETKTELLTKLKRLKYKL